ncbi:hypothetical protein [Paenibacillus glycinis]|uniref:Uncharacterized protein n=1 Tax=Paenibacillus glycinis TaxID=2697035 RepID=A0ABW9XZ80_9BACL|nr:hypothetical protein [Paenibacillus glycinis]NBD27569.1 hypothetical protein [Paenibacillus glycinis]
MTVKKTADITDMLIVTDKDQVIRPNTTGINRNDPFLNIAWPVVAAGLVEKGRYHLNVHDSDYDFVYGGQ